MIFFFNAWVLKYPICRPWFVDFHHKRYVTTTSITTRNNEHSEIDRPTISPPGGCDFLESKGKNCFVRVWFFFFKKGIYFYIRTFLDILEAQKLKEQLNHDNISWSWSNFGLLQRRLLEQQSLFLSKWDSCLFVFILVGANGMVHQPASGDFIQESRSTYSVSNLNCLHEIFLRICDWE